MTLPFRSGAFFVLLIIAPLFTSWQKAQAQQSPSITTQPQSLSAVVGTNVAFSVVASGQSPLSYKWYFKNVPLTNSAHISGSAGTTLAISGILTNDAGNYSVTVSNKHGVATSSAAALTVLVRVSVTSPTNRTVIFGSNTTFTVTANGTSPLAYQWFYNDAPLADGERFTGSQTAALNITGVLTNDAGSYRVQVSNAFSSANSSNAFLAVLTPPSFRQQPQSQIGLAGNTVAFTTMAEGTQPLTYQWFFNDSILTDSTRMSGTTNSTLTITELMTNDAGNYFVQVSNSAGVVVSSNAALTVNLPFPDVPHVVGFSPTAAAAGANVNITGENFSPIAASNLVTFGAAQATVLSASETNLLVSVPVGATYAPITVMVNGLVGYAHAAFEPTFAGNGQPIGASTFAPRQDMAIAYGNFHTLITDLDGDGKPDLMVNYGRTISLLRNIGTNGSLSASSFAPRVDLVGDVSDSIYGFTSADADGDGKRDLIFCDTPHNRIGIYRNVSTPGNLSFFSPVYFDVGSGPTYARVQDLDADGKPDIATTCSGAGSISILKNISTPGSLDTNSFAAAISFASGTGLNDVVIQDFDGDGKPDFAVSYHDTAFISVFRNVTTPGEIALNSFAPKVDFPTLIQNLTIFAADIDGDGKPELLAGGKGSTLCVYQNLASPGSLTNNSFASQVNFGNPGWVHDIAMGDIDGDGKSDIIIVGELGSYMAVYKNQSTPGDFTTGSIARTDYGTGWNAWGVSVGDLDGDGRADVVFCNNYDGTITFYRNATPPGGPPVIVSQPTNRTVVLGANTSFAVIAEGSQPLAYQWLFNNTPLADGGRINGATNAALNVTGVQTNDTGAYLVVISNRFGAVTSVVATLDIGVPPAVTTSPLSQTNLTGSTATFTVAADGTAPLNYQWRFNGANLSDNFRINGATNSSLTVSNLISSDAGNYDVIVMNPVGSVTSVVATLTIPQPPSFTTQPVGRSVIPGLPTTFSAAAVSSSPISYQWQFNSVDIPYATNASYSISAVSTNDFGSYRLMASNEIGVATSAIAELTFGSVVAWGRNQSGESLPPPGLSNVFAVAGSSGSSIAVRTDGSVVAWGAGFGTNVPTGVTNVVAISSSGGTVALRADGSIIGWGFGTVAVNQIPSLTNIVAVAAGFSHGLALRSDGQVLGFGNYPASTVPAGLGDVSKIACGVNHSLALRSDGTVIAWGTGSGTNVPSGLKDVVAIAGGVSHSLALKSDGTVIAWGTGSGTNLPKGLTNIVAISTGGYPQGPAVNLAIRSNGTVVAWGDNSFGETNTPSVLSNLVSVAVAGAPYHSLAIVGDGKPLIIEQPVGGTSWTGREFQMSASAVGNGSLSYQWQFNGVDIAGATNSSITLANLTTNNAGSYQLIVSNVFGVAVSIPAPLKILSNVPPTLLSQPSSIQTNYLGNTATLGVTVAGSGPITYQWRIGSAAGPITNIPGATNATLVFDPVLMSHSGFYSALVTSPFGSTSTRGTTLRVQPIRVWGYQAIEPPSTLTNAIAVAAGFNHYLALRPDGKIVGWGSSLNGEAGAPANLSNSIVTAISAGYQHSLALRSDGIPVAWGYNNFAITNVPASANNVIAISAGRDFDLALRADGTVVAWGNNYPYSQTNVPVSATNVVAISAGSSHSLALRSNGTVIGWGYNTYGQITIPTGATNIIGIAVGGSHSLALRADGTVLAWGYNFSGQTNVPAGLSNVVSIAASGGHNTALRSDGSVVSWGSYLFYNTSGSITPQGDFDSAIQIADGGDRSICLFGTRVPAITIQPFGRVVFKGSNTVLTAKAAAAQPTSYQWLFNGANISGATNDSLSLTNLQFAQSGAYQLVVSNRYGITASKPAKVVVSIPVGLALDFEKGVTWISSGVSAWFGQTNTTHDHIDAARSGDIEHGQETILQTILQTSPTQISFWWKVSSETGFDKLEFLVNGVVQATISGEVDWQQRIVPIPVGSPLLQWRYSKDGSGSIGQDAGFVDQISLVPNPPVITVQPVGKTVNLGTNVTFFVGVSGTGPFGFKWRKNETNLLGDGSLLVLNNVGRAQRGVYSVIVTNAGGSVTSSNAILNVLVPQQLGAPTFLSDGTFQFSSTDADGGLLSPADLANLELQTSADLTNWTALPNGLSLTNGTLLLKDTEQTNFPVRFYRIIEH